MEKTYPIEIAGIKRELPICAVGENLSIAAFVLFGDVEVTVAAASALLKVLPQFDAVICPEAKAIPLAYELARRTKKPYFVARKKLKAYIKNPVAFTYKSITTAGEQSVYLGENEANALKGKSVLIVDDVISTGETLAALEALLKQIGASIAAKAAILAEGEAAKRKDIVFLNEIPLFYRK